MHLVFYTAIQDTDLYRIQRTLHQDKENTAVNKQKIRSKVERDVFEWLLLNLQNLK